MRSFWSHREVIVRIKWQYDNLIMIYGYFIQEYSKLVFVYTDLWSTSNSLLIISRSFLLFSSSILKWPQVTSDKSSLVKWYYRDKENLVQSIPGPPDSPLQWSVFRWDLTWMTKKLNKLGNKILKLETYKFWKMIIDLKISILTSKHFSLLGKIIL